MQDLNALPLDELFESLTGGGALDRLLEAARREDLDEGVDVTTESLIDPDETAAASVTTRQSGIISGLRVIPHLVGSWNAAIECEVAANDGSPCSAGDEIAHLTGRLRDLLAVERTLLNILGRLSGIATLTRRFVERVRGTRALVTDTRKTTPGLRALEKYAVRCGGGTLHRLGLYDAVLYKDNHLSHISPDCLTDALNRAARRAREHHDLRFVEVEADSIEQLERILDCERGLIDCVLLDNMSPEQLARAVRMREKRAPAVLLEASGGINLENVREIAETGVDRISIGALTHSAAALDIGLDLRRT